MSTGEPSKKDAGLLPLPYSLISSYMFGERMITTIHIPAESYAQVSELVLLLNPSGRRQTSRTAATANSLISLALDLLLHVITVSYTGIPNPIEGFAADVLEYAKSNRCGTQEAVLQVVNQLLERAVGATAAPRKRS